MAEHESPDEPAMWLRDETVCYVVRSKDSDGNPGTAVYFSDAVTARAYQALSQEDGIHPELSAVPKPETPTSNGANGHGHAGGD